MKASRFITLLLHCQAVLAVWSLQAQVEIPFVNQPLVPDHRAPSPTSFAMTINGTGFNNPYVLLHHRGGAVYFLYPSTWTSSQLQLTVPGSSFPQPETLWVEVCNSFSFCAPKSDFFSFSAQHSAFNWNRFDTVFGAQPERQVAGKLNADGNFDLVSVDGPNNQILLFFGNGNGTFQTPITHSTGTNPSNLALAPFQGYAIPDVVTTNYSANSVSIVLRDPDSDLTGQFFLPGHTDFPVGNGPVAVAVADFNRDRNMDLAVVNSLDDTVSILLGNGDGTFQPQVPFATGSNPADIAVGDFNGDGKLDLAVANFGYYGGNTVSVLLGNGSGTFKSKTDFRTDGGTQSVIASDINRDGILDLVTANGCGHAPVCGNPGTVSVLLGKGNGTFRSAVNYDAGSYPFTVTAANFRSSKALDLAVTDLDSAEIYFLLGNGDGTFGNPFSIATNGRPVGLVSADFNDDGKVDLAVGGDSPAGVTVMLQQ
jgi:FG-GAP-like repeat